MGCLFAREQATAPVLCLTLTFVSTTDSRPICENESINPRNHQARINAQLRQDHHFLSTYTYITLRISQRWSTDTAGSRMILVVLKTAVEATSCCQRLPEVCSSLAYIFSLHACGAFSSTGLISVLCLSSCHLVPHCLFFKLLRNEERLQWSGCMPLGSNR